MKMLFSGPSRPPHWRFRSRSTNVREALFVIQHTVIGSTLHPQSESSLELPACTLAMDTLFPPPQRFHGAGRSIRILSSSLSNATSRLPFADNRRRTQDILPVTKKLAQLIICSAHQSPCRSTTSRALPCSRSATVKHKMRATLKELTFLTSTVPRPPQRCRTTEIIPC